jgi:hypothetical protein
MEQDFWFQAWVIVAGFASVVLTAIVVLMH